MGSSAVAKKSKPKTAKKESSVALPVAKSSKPSLASKKTVQVKAKKVTKGGSAKTDRAISDTKHSYSDRVETRGLSVAEMLAERLRKRREQEENPDGMDAPRRSRRGRKPKNVSDFSGPNEESGMNSDTDFRGLEYDTGIRVRNSADENGFVLDRSDDFEEELNFDS